MSDSKECVFIMKTSKTAGLVLCAMLTALVAVLQFTGGAIRFGPFSMSVVLIPIVVGAAMCGTAAGAWLGLVFGAVVLLTDSTLFMAFSIPGTVVTVLLKGVLCGLCSALVFKALKKANTYLAVIAAAITCPIVNTGVFLLGCRVFFMPLIGQWAAAADFGTNIASYMILVLVGTNFLFELGINVILSPVIVRILKIKGAN